MGPTERERNRFTRRRVGDALVGGVAVALHDAAITFEQLERMDRAAPGRVAIGDRRRIGPAPRPVVAGHGPEVSLLGAAAAGIEHGRHSLTAILPEARMSSRNRK